MKPKSKHSTALIAIGVFSAVACARQTSAVVFDLADRSVSTSVVTLSGFLLASDAQSNSTTGPFSQTVASSFADDSGSASQTSSLLIISGSSLTASGNGTANWTKQYSTGAPQNVAADSLFSIRFTPLTSASFTLANGSISAAGIGASASFELDQFGSSAPALFNVSGTSNFSGSGMLVAGATYELIADASQVVTTSSSHISSASWSFSFSMTEIPEPTTPSTLSLGLAALGWKWRKSFRHSRQAADSAVYLPPSM